VVAALACSSGRTILGKAVLATAYNKLAAQIGRINTRFILLLSFGLAAALGALGGILVAPITYTSYDAGIMMGLKGFVAATLGGLGSRRRRRRGRPALGAVEADDRRLHLVRLQGRHALRPDPSHPLLPAARAVRKKTTDRV